MGDEAVRRWMEGYVRAWTSNEPDDIRALFTEGASYRTAPWRKRWRGHDEIVRGWLERKDEPGSWRFRWEIHATSGDRAFVRGWTDYDDGSPRTHNLWDVTLTEDGRCSEFTEWWMYEAD
jgi:hypothetical protein